MAFSRTTMCIETPIADGSPLVPIRDWRPEDLIRFTSRAAQGIDKAELARFSAVEVEVVEALLEVPEVKTVVDACVGDLTCSDEEFDRRLRISVRSQVMQMLEERRASPAVLFYMHFIYEYLGDSPVNVTIAALLRCVRRKRRRVREAARTVERPKPQAPPVRLAREDELNVLERGAVGVARLFRRGMRETMTTVAGELLAQGIVPRDRGETGPLPLSLEAAFSDADRAKAAALRAELGAPDDPMESLLFLADMLAADGRTEEADEIREVVAWRQQRPQGP